MNVIKNKCGGIVTLGLAMIHFLGCAGKSVQYYDSVLNDKNRAPSSIGFPSHLDADYQHKQKVESRAQADYLYIQAELKSQRGEVRQALALLQKVVELDPHSAQLNYRIANEYFRVGQVERAIEWVEKSLMEDPLKKESQLLAAGLYSTERKYGKAEKIYKRVIEKYKNDPEAYLYLAALYSEQKKYNLALDYFAKATRFEDYNQKHLVYYYRARTFLEKEGIKSKSKIVNDLKESLRQKPDFFEALQFLAKIIETTESKKKSYAYLENYQKQYGPFPPLAEALAQHHLQEGDYDKAYEQLEFIEITSNDPIDVKLKMALILIDKKMYDKASERLKELEELVPESDKIKYYLGAISDELKKYDSALQYYGQIPKESSYFEDSIKRTALIYKFQNRTDKAIEALEILASAKPDQLENHLALAHMYEETNQLDKALEGLVKVEGRFSDSSMLMFTLGVLSDKKNQKDNMLNYMRRSVALDESNAQALNYLAYSLLEMNLAPIEEIERMALKAYNLESDDPYITDTVGWIYYKKGEYKKALTYLEKAHKIVPHVSVIIDHLGDVYVKLNQLSKAISMYEKAFNLETDLQRKREINSKITEYKVKNEERAPASLKSKPIYEETRALNTNE